MKDDPDFDARVRELRADAEALGVPVQPPESAWEGIRARIEHAKVVPLAASPASSPRMAARAIAAGIALVVASSTVTAVFMHWNADRLSAFEVAGVSDTSGPAMVPASLMRMESGYLKTVNELTSVLNASRSKLSPETVRSVERSLRVIDDALDEARGAILRDPASAVLRDMLSKVYQQKVDLLRRASERARST